MPPLSYLSPYPSPSPSPSPYPSPSDTKFLDDNLTPVLVSGLKQNHICSPDRDWSNMTNEEAVSLLREVAGCSPHGWQSAMDRY